MWGRAEAMAGGGRRAEEAGYRKLPTLGQLSHVPSERLLPGTANWFNRSISCSRRSPSAFLFPQSLRRSNPLHLGPFDISSFVSSDDSSSLFKHEITRLGRLR